MPKKKPAAKRLDKLFQNITPEETSSAPKRAPRQKPVEEKAATGQQPPQAERPVSISPATRPVGLIQRAPAKSDQVLSVRFQVGQNNWATLQALDNEREGQWTPDDELLVSQVADQLSLALENARLFQETETRAKEVSVLNEVGQALASTLNLEQITQITYNGISRLFDARNFYIAFYDRQNNEIIFPQNISESEVDRAITRIPLGQGITSHMIRTRESVLIKDGSDKWMLERGETPVGEPAQSFAGVPLIANEKVLGVIAIQDYVNQNKYDDQDLQLLTSFASQTAIAIENAQLFEETASSQATLSEALRIARIGYFEVEVVSQNISITDELFAILNTTAEIEGGHQFPARDVLKKFVSPDDYTAAIKAYEKAIKTGKLGQEVSIEARYLTRDGRVIWVSTTYKAELDEKGRVYKVAGSSQDITERKTNELIQSAITEISDATLTESSIQGLIKSIHNAIRILVPAKNFYVALYDAQNDWMTFPYYVDEHDQPMPSQKLGRGLTSYVIRTGKALRTTPEIYSELVASGEVVGGGTASVDWLGVPLRSETAIRGVMAIQSYDPSVRVTPQHQNILTVLATQVAASIERLLAREALSKSEADLRALFSSMQDVVIVYDKDGRYVRIAPTNPSLLFRPPQDMVGKLLHEVLPEDLHEQFMTTIQRVLAGEENVNTEYPLILEGKQFWFDASVSKLTDDQVFWVARDISERKHSEEALQRRNRYLAISAEVGKLVTSTLDLNKIFTETVSQVKEGFGLYFAAMYSIEETGFNAGLRGATGEAGEQMLASKHSVGVGSQTVVGLVAESGTAKLIEDVYNEPLYRPNPLLPDTRSEVAIPLRIGSRIVAVLDLHSNQQSAFTEDDISVLQLLSDQVAVAIDNARSYELSQQLIKDLREVDKLKSQFLANMSHELRTPLNSIIGFSRVILKGIDGPITDMQQQDLTAIYNSGQHLLGLINDVLDLARIEAGKMELNFEEVNLAEMVQSVLSTAKGLVKEKPIQLISNVPAETYTVRGDTMRIRQIFINLLSNASKFTDEGAIRVEALNQKNPDGRSEVIIRVTDTGPGISLEDQEKLFKAFSQVDGSATRKSGGTGLGLSICSNLVQLHGGRIGVTSEGGKGSTFWFTLQPYHQPLGEIPANQKVVVAIDDDPKVISLYERYLTPQGYYVVPFLEAKGAKERILAIKPYAITLDVMMPNIDGWTLLSELKSDPATRDIPVLICSILEEADKGFNLGAADYLTKPILEEDLVHAMGRLDKKGQIHNILVIDDSAEDRRLIQKILGSNGKYEIEVADGGREGWEAIKAKTPHAVILDLFMPDWDGFTVLEKLREDSQLRNLPVLVISGGGLNEQQSKQLQDFGKRLLLKGSLKENELITSIEEALELLG